MVSTFTDMPEGASISDNDHKDDNDVDDPHKALDIDLDVYVSLRQPSSAFCSHFSIKFQAFTQ